MSKSFQLFHLSLIEKRQNTLFSASNTSLSREESLRKIFAENFQFIHRNKKINWVSKNLEAEYIVGIMERETEHTHHRPPEEGGDEITEPDWQGAVVIIDPRAHDEGQRAALEVDKFLGTPSSLIKSLLKHINSRELIAYVIESRPIFDSQSFWSFSESHGHRVKRISFDFSVPNMWGTHSALEKELKDTADTTGAESVGVKFSSEGGIQTDSDRIRQGVDYSERGGGAITAKALDGSSYRSMKTIKTNKVDKGEFLEKENFIDMIQRLAKFILKS